MYFAHAGHHHVEENINKEIDPIQVIAIVFVIVAVAVVIPIVFDAVKKRGSGKKKKQ